MKVAIILGTRPEIIKMAPVIHACQKEEVPFFIIHTGQHYDIMMDAVFFQELQLRHTLHNLNIGSGTHGEMTAKMIMGIEKILVGEKPDVVLVQGDTDTVLAGALASAKVHIPIGHVEAGLRSFDRRLPEEYNRIICDHMSDYLFAPTQTAKENLQREGIASQGILYERGEGFQSIFVTGNTIVDAILQNKERIDQSRILEHLNLEKSSYFLVTLHREETVDHKDRLKSVLEGLKAIINSYKMPIIFPIHPRTVNRLKEFNLLDQAEKIHGLQIISPLGFLDIMSLESNAKLVLTDSGGIQEEACCFKVPCVVLRERSDRPESIEAGAAILAGCNAEKILIAVQTMLQRKNGWENPFGDGHAGENIIKILTRFH
ncbi:MAG: UDP-N-acetylglucosamine 2-epimerase (non-hydrolyzing) [Candidatus Wildermuthbacteria bacterium]|nr:UDP-N-acetylglucosamine 2-epimerase (non-hydrolyzing) [Candidatus Wildermuthbacteria bacterium]